MDCDLPVPCSRSKQFIFEKLFSHRNCVPIPDPAVIIVGSSRLAASGTLKFFTSRGRESTDMSNIQPLPGALRSQTDRLHGQPHLRMSNPHAHANENCLLTSFPTFIRSLIRSPARGGDDNPGLAVPDFEPRKSRQRYHAFLRLVNSSTGVIA